MKRYEVKLAFKGVLGEVVKIIDVPAGMRANKDSLVQQALRLVGTYPRTYDVVSVEEISPIAEAVKSPTEEKCEVHIETIKVGIEGLFDENRKLSEVLSIVSQLAITLWSNRLDALYKTLRGI